MESTDNDEQVTLKKGVGKKRKRVEIGYEHSTCTLVDVEQQRLVIEKQRLRVEEDRLQVERKRLEIEEERLKLEKEKHKLYLCQMGIIPSVDISVQPESEQHLI
ncbi:myb/SANT-like DNA-binding domain-containing protein 4 [Crassostrea angulata]|uniref:myb/SANT-like DNA-binding domain-containing protein 4 n=1 Tax=Magallana angulata TaxID=2784310 RepID=UPI0022B202E9|nr:myb/SANT-like DNA-binding domain-containing protein 4 [Crassostrea angulata]